MTRDLVVLAADADIEWSIRGLFGRPTALGIRSIDFEVIRSPHRDPGCWRDAPGLLQPFADTSMHALVVFHHAWDGVPDPDPDRVARMVEQRLARDWNDRARCIVIAPEVEVWVWSDSPHVEEILWWRRLPSLRSWLEAEGLWPKLAAKPPDPKQAFRRVTRRTGRRATASVFRALAEKVCLQRLDVRRSCD